MSNNVFETGIPLEEMSPDAHHSILSAARHLAFAQLFPESRAVEMQRADHSARAAASFLHSETRTGARTVWLQVVRYAAELHAARLVTEYNAQQYGGSEES